MTLTMNVNSGTASGGAPPSGVTLRIVHEAGARECNED